MSNNPYAGISSKRLVDLINSTNGTALVEGVDFYFGPPRAVAGAQGFNTRVRLHRLTSQYPSDIDVEYTRRPLSDLHDLPAGMIESPNLDSPVFRVHEILPEINEALGLSLLADEVENTNFTTEQENYPIKITGRSLAWTEGSVFNLRILSVLLKSVVIQRTLDGLFPPTSL